MADFERPNVSVQKTHLFKNFCTPQKNLEGVVTTTPLFNATLTYMWIPGPQWDQRELSFTLYAGQHCSKWIKMCLKCLKLSLQCLQMAKMHAKCHAPRAQNGYLEGQSCPEKGPKPFSVKFGSLLAL